MIAIRRSMLALALVFVCSAALASKTGGDDLLPTEMRGFEASLEELAAEMRPAEPRPRATCKVINGVSAYLGCKVTSGGSSTTYYNCTSNPAPCMDEEDCEDCTNIPDDD